MAITPKVAVGCPSKIGVHVVPWFVDFHSPPVADATMTVLGSVGSAATSCRRPPMTAGPMDRNRNSRNGPVGCWAVPVMVNARQKRKVAIFMSIDCLRQFLFDDI